MEVTNVYKHDFWQNNKNGNIYIIENTGVDCTNSRDGTKVVVYKRIGATCELFVRELQEFKSKFTKVDVE